MTNSSASTDNPFVKIKDWLARETQLGSPNPNRITLATCMKNAIPHSRVVAIREISSTGLLFFTQRATKKVAEMENNPKASMTLWLAQQQRQVVLDGTIIPLTEKENQKYWDANPKEQQLRFSTYAETSGKKLPSPSYLQEKFKTLSAKYAEDEALPISSEYVGFLLVIEEFYFYTLGSHDFSEIEKYFLVNHLWNKEYLSP